MKSAPTAFAPAERAEWEELAEQISSIRKNTPLQENIKERRDLILLLNGDRQVIFANQTFLTEFQIEDPATIYGCRPGEILGCQHAGKGEGGCGTSKDCRCCRAVHAILKSIRGQPDIQQCRIELKDKGEPLHFLIFTVPIRIASFPCILVKLADPELEKSHDFGHQVLELQHLVTAIERA